jgi:hypothetical protein
LTSVLLGSVRPEEAIREVWNSGEGSELHLLSAGIRPPNPSELLGSQRMKDFLDSQLERFDLILLDTPPCLPVTDPVVVAGLADTTILVMRTRVSKGRHVRRALEVLYQAGALLGGVVVIGLSPAGSYGYGKRYGEKYRYESKHSVGAKRADGGLGLPLVLRRMFRRENARQPARAVGVVEELFVPSVGPVSVAPKVLSIVPNPDAAALGLAVNSASNGAFGTLEMVGTFLPRDDHSVQTAVGSEGVGGPETPERIAGVGSSLAREDLQQFQEGSSDEIAEGSNDRQPGDGNNHNDHDDHDDRADNNNDEHTDNQHTDNEHIDNEHADNEEDGEPGSGVRGESAGSSRAQSRPTPAGKRGVRNRRKHRSVRLEKAQRRSEVDSLTSPVEASAASAEEDASVLEVKTLWASPRLPASAGMKAPFDPLNVASQVARRLPGIDPLRPLGW